METALIGFVAGLAGAATLNLLLAPLWDLSGLRNRIHVELLLCDRIGGGAGTGLDRSHDVRKLQVLAAELQSFTQSASRLTRALVARKGYDLSTAVETLIGLSNSLAAGTDGAAGHIARTRAALRIPEIGFSAGRRLDDRADYQAA